MGAIAADSAVIAGATTLTGTTTANGAVITTSTVDLQGTNTVSGVATFTAAPLGYGIVPLGSIIGISTNLTGSHAVPSTGTVDSAGWQYCDGAVIPGSQSLSGTTPNLTGSRFLMGSTTSGSTGGQTNVTLTSTELPTHTHTGPSHTHTGTTTTNGDHTHGITNNGFNMSETAASGGGAPRATNLSSDRLAPSIDNAGDHTHTFTTAAGGTGATGSTGSGSAYENRPLFYSVQYLIRVK